MCIMATSKIFSHFSFSSSIFSHLYSPFLRHFSHRLTIPSLSFLLSYSQSISSLCIQITVIFSLITVIILGELNKLWSLSVCSLLHLTFSSLMAQIFILASCSRLLLRSGKIFHNYTVKNLSLLYAS